jgi:hypothetical protein
MTEEVLEPQNKVTFKHMKLSELLVSEEKYNYVYGVDVDEESFTPPDDLNEVSFIYKTDDSGDLDEILLDVIISYGLSDMSVILEVPFEEEIEDPEYLMSVASNAGFSLSILPPVEMTEENMEGYRQRISEFTDAFLGQKNFSKFLYPLSSYLEYLYLETFIDVSDFKASDEYMVNKFVDTTTEDFSNSFKAVMRDKVFSHFGGEEEFRNFTKAVFSKIYETTEANCLDNLQQMQEDNSQESESS